jgi:protein-tyrosine phosphatase
MNHVLFLCSGNYYRSRFAEILFNWHAERKCSEWRARSRGLAIDPRNPGPISRHTLEYLNRLGIEMTACKRLPMDVSETDFAAAQVIVAVKEAEHRPMIQARFPQWEARVEFWNVHDLDCATPCDAIPQLEMQVKAIFQRVTGSDGWSPI